MEATRRPDVTRAVLSDRLVVVTELDPYLSLTALAEYCGLSVRTLRKLIDLPPHQALPCFRPGGKILVRRSDFDAWMAQYRTRGRPDVARVLQELGLDRTDV